MSRHAQLSDMDLKRFYSALIDGGLSEALEFMLRDELERTRLSACEVSF